MIPFFIYSIKKPLNSRLELFHKHPKLLLRRHLLLLVALTLLLPIHFLLLFRFLLFLLLFLQLLLLSVLMNILQFVHKTHYLLPVLLQLLEIQFIHLLLFNLNHLKHLYLNRFATVEKKETVKSKPSSSAPHSFSSNSNDRKLTTKMSNMQKINKQKKKTLKFNHNKILLHILS